MKNIILFIILSLLLLSCNKEQKQEEALRKLRKDILEVHIFNRTSHKITNSQISITDYQFNLSNTLKIEDIEPSGKTMFLYDCRGKIHSYGVADLALEIRCQLDSNEVSDIFGAITEGTMFLRAINCDVYENDIIVNAVFWTDYN